MSTTGSSCACRPLGALGIALSGGGARGLAQLGLLKVLDREGVPVSYVAGTSAGAVVGAVYTTSRDAQEAEERLVAHLRTTGPGFNIETLTLETGAAPSPLSHARLFWRVARHGRSVIPCAPVRDSLARLLQGRSFNDTRVPFATTALDLVSGRRMIFAEGPLTDAVYASAAIPGLFEPFGLDGRLLVDGGWAEPVPVETCHHLGAIHVIAVDVPPIHPEAVARSPMEVALRADTLTRDLLEFEQLRRADLVVRVHAQVRHFADFGDLEGLIAAGERAAEASLDAIRDVLDRHHRLFVTTERGPEEADAI